MADPYAATPDDRFSFGLWTVGHRGSDPFGVATRPPIEPQEIVARLGEVGAWGVCFHDDDLVPFGSSAADRDRIVGGFGKAVADAGLCVSMATVNLFTQPVFKDGAMTAADPAVRRFALRKTCAAIDIGAELGAPIFVLWGGREGVETAAARDPRVALERYREGVNFLCEYVIDQGYDIRFALEAKPNEPRGHLYLPTTGHMLHFIEYARAPGDGRRQPRDGARVDGRPVLLGTPSGRRCGPASSSTSISTPRTGRATTRTSASAPRTSRRRS